MFYLHLSCPPALPQTHSCRDDGAPAMGALFLRVIDPSTGGGAGRRTDRFSDGFDALQIQATSSGRRPSGLFIQENAGGGDYFIGGGAGRACMNDLVVDQWASDGECRSHRDFMYLYDV